MTTRFYEIVTVEPCIGGFEIHLDGKAVKTPGRRILTAPTKELGGSISQEWQSQKTEIDRGSMPLTRLCESANDRADAEWGTMREEICKYATSDLLCYRAEEPADLVKLQDEEWQPLLDWAGESIGLKLVATRGVVAIEQEEASLTALRAWLEKVPNFRLVGLHSAVPLSGSAVIGLALLNGKISPQKAIEASFLDEIWQEAQWGQDEEAKTRRSGLRTELEGIHGFMRALDDLHSGEEP